MQVKETNEIKRYIMKERTKIDAANLFLVQQMSEDPLFEYDEEYHKKPIDAVAEDFYETSYADNQLLKFVLDKIKKAMTLKRFKSARERYLNDAYVKMILQNGLVTAFERTVSENDSSIHAELTLLKCAKNDVIEFGDYAYVDGVYVPKFALVDKTFFHPVLMGNGITYEQFTMKDYMEVNNKISKLKGKVLILNDVFGYMTYHAARRRDVEEIVVVCDSGEMYYSFLKDFLVKKCKDFQKIKLIDRELLEYVKTINKDDFDYVFANICEFASADEMLIRRELKLKGIQCDYHLENHYAKYLSPTISTLIAEEVKIDDEYVKERQELIVNKDKYEEAQLMSMREGDCEGEYESFSDYEEFAYDDEEFEMELEDTDVSMEELTKEWMELINEMVEDTQFEVDMAKNAYDDVVIRTVEDLERTLSPEFILEKL